MYGADVTRFYVVFSVCVCVSVCLLNCVCVCVCVLLAHIVLGTHLRCRVRHQCKAVLQRIWYLLLSGVKRIMKEERLHLMHAYAPVAVW